MNAKDGGPAFPSTNELRQQVGDVVFATEGHAGLSVRDYFAAAALQGLCSNGPLAMGLADLSSTKVRYNLVAESAYRHADAMLAERSK